MHSYKTTLPKIVTHSVQAGKVYFPVSFCGLVISDASPCTHDRRPFSPLHNHDKEKQSHCHSKETRRQTFFPNGTPRRKIITFCAPILLPPWTSLRSSRIAGRPSQRRRHRGGNGKIDYQIFLPSVFMMLATEMKTYCKDSSTLLGNK